MDFYLESNALACKYSLTNPAAQHQFKTVDAPRGEHTEAELKESFFSSVGEGRAEESAVFSSRRPAAHSRPLGDHHLHCVQRVCEYLHPSVCLCIHPSLPLLSLYLQQVILECSLDSCFSYIYQYEPYMKDSVGFPKVMVSSAALGLWYDLRCTERIITSVLVDAGVAVLCFPAPDRVCLWALHSWMHVDVGLDADPRRSCRSGEYTGTSAGTTETETEIKLKLNQI